MLMLWLGLGSKPLVNGSEKIMFCLKYPFGLDAMSVMSQPLSKNSPFFVPKKQLQMEIASTPP